MYIANRLYQKHEGEETEREISWKMVLHNFRIFLQFISEISVGKVKNKIVFLLYIEKRKNEI